jgi:hypothetical protein
MRKLCPAVLILVLLTACTATHARTAARSAQTPTTQPALSATESTTPSSTQAAVTPKPTAATRPRSSSPVSEAKPLNVTGHITVRPVTSTGQPAPGYSVTNEDLASFSCTGKPSPVAVSPNIRFCGYSATNTVACWKSSVPATVLCLRDPLTRKLVRIKYTGQFAPTPAPAHPVPQALVLDDDNNCQIRDGGAWDYVPSQPTWVGWYYCAADTDVYGPKAGNGIDQTRPSWTVHTVVRGGSAMITSHSVTTAYFVGTA